MAGIGALVNKLKGFGQAAPNAVQRAAEGVVRELQDRGPYWTGQFHDSWEITLNKEGASARNTVAIISNGAPHALIAMDLEPGRFGESKNNTAPYDWYLTYVTGGELDRSVEIVANDVLAQTWRRGL
jgi:hypothetical protein